VVAAVGDVVQLAFERRERAVEQPVAVGDVLPGGAPAGEALGQLALALVQDVDREAP
jgi:hypothetical protein